MRGVAAALALLLALAPAAEAQQRRPAAPQAKEQPAPPPEPPPAAYEPELLKLAEVLGALSFLTELCGEAGATLWRDRMVELVEAEGTTTQRKERLAGAFNRGYLGHQPAHRACTERGRQAIERLIDHGQRLARDLTGRYAG